MSYEFRVMSLLRNAAHLIRHGFAVPPFLLRYPVLSLARTPASLTDRSHSLRVLDPPPAALPSLPPKGKVFSPHPSPILPSPLEKVAKPGS